MFTDTRKSYNDVFPVWSIDDVWGFRVGGGVHDSYTFPCGLVGYFTSPGIDTRYKGPTAFSVSSERHWQGGVNGIAKVPKRSEKFFPAAGLEPLTVRSPANSLAHSATPRRQYHHVIHFICCSTTELIP